MAYLNSTRHKKKKELQVSLLPKKGLHPGGGGELNKVLYGEVPPTTGGLTPYNFYAIVDRKGTPSVYLTLTNRTPFTYLV